MSDFFNCGDLMGYMYIKEFYGDQRAKRSQVPLMNHITEGIWIMHDRGISSDAMNAFALHPMFQADDAMAKYNTDELHINLIRQMPARIIVMAMEYRNIANRHLSHDVVPTTGIKLSPLTEVNEMLVADKVQNRKDFEIYHKGTHPRSKELDQYFHDWLDALGISEVQYQAYLTLIETNYANNPTYWVKL